MTRGPAGHFIPLKEAIDNIIYSSFWVEERTTSYILSLLFLNPTFSSFLTMAPSPPAISFIRSRRMRHTDDIFIHNSCNPFVCLLPYNTTGDNILMIVLQLQREMTATIMATRLQLFLSQYLKKEMTSRFTEQSTEGRSVSEATGL